MFFNQNYAFNLASPFHLRVVFLAVLTGKFPWTKTLLCHASIGKNKLGETNSIAWQHDIRAVASLSLPGGQNKNISSILHHFPVFWLIFPQICFSFFLILVFRVGAHPPGKVLATPLHDIALTLHALGCNSSCIDVKTSNTDIRSPLPICNLGLNEIICCHCCYWF